MNNLITALLIFISMSLLSNIYLVEQSATANKLSHGLCDRINVIEFNLLDVELTDCEMIYGR